MSLFQEELLGFIEKKYPYTRGQVGGVPLPSRPFHAELGIEEVKPPFQSLEIIKKMLIDTSLVSLYKKRENAPKIILLTYVYWDGLGDYYGAKHCATFLRSQGIECIQVTLLKKGMPVIEKDHTHLFFEPKKEVVFPEKVLEEMRDAHLILQFPTFYPFTERLKEKVGKGPKWECLGESGFIDTPDFYPGKGRRCMGLHHLEKGLFIPMIQDLEESPLKTPYFFAYTRTAKGLSDFIEAVLQLEKKRATICTFKLSIAIEMIKKYPPPSLGKVHLYYEHFHVVETIKGTGEEIYLYVQEKVDHNVFLSLLNGAEEFVACTGDTSFFEALALNKCIFYDSPQHKKRFWSDLKRIAKESIPAAYPFFENPATLKDKKVRHGVKMLNHLIIKKHQTNHFLLHLIYRAYTHFLFPEIEKKESFLLSDYAQGAIDDKEFLRLSQENAISE